MQRTRTALARSVRVASSRPLSSASALLLALFALLAFGDLAQAADGTWIEIPPPTRRDHTAILDPGHDRMLVFGGYEGDVPRSDVYALSLATSEWTKVYVPGGPSARVGHSAIYDPVRNRMLVFGGSDGTTWALSLSDPPQWTLIEVQGTPPSARYQHTAIYDPAGERMLIFGGRDASGLKNDLWALSLAGTPTWTQITPNGTLPVGRTAHTAILDPVRRRMLVFGGQGSSVLDDLWALSLDGTPAWTAIVPPGTRPLRTYEHIAVYDPAHDRMIVSGGNHGDIYGTQDCWALPLAPGSSWERFPMLDRSQHTGIYDPLRDAVVAYGGLVIFGNDNATWRLALASIPQWQLVTSSGPAVMELAATTVHDPVGGRMIAFGGNGSGCIDACPTGATTSYSLVDRRWTWLTNGPERYDHSAIYDPVRHRMLVFGGSDFYGSLPRHNDTWELPLAGPPAWNELLPAGSLPARRRAHTAIYDPVGDRMLVFGGIDSNFEVGPRFNDVWQLSLGSLQWTLLSPLGAPPSPRENHTAIYDPAGERMLIFGGRDAAGLKNDLWALSLTGTPAWTLITPEGIPPSPREGHTAIYDPVRSRIVVFGGTSEDDVWSLDLASSATLAWSLFDADGIAPSGRQEHTAIYDPAADRMVVCGGWSQAIWQWLGTTAVTVLTLHDVAAVPVSAAPTPGLVLLGARPNPASGAFEVLFESARARPAVLELIDVAGRRIARQELGVLAPGSHRVRFDDLRIPAGTYFLRLTQDGRSTSSKIALVP